MDGSLCDLRGDLIGDGPLVTVVVPVYNTPEGPLRRCLRSILSQDYANIELIVVDDGSSGECVVVLNDALGADPRSRVIGGGTPGCPMPATLESMRHRENGWSFATATTRCSRPLSRTP